MRDLFGDDLAEQRRKLMEMIGVVVAGLDRLETILPGVQRLGQRHRDYGALPEHYDVVGACLIWTLHQGLGEQFTADVEAAWVAAYELLAGTMMAAPGEGAPELTAA